MVKVKLILFISGLLLFSCNNEVAELNPTTPTAVTFDRTGTYSLFHDGLTREFIFYKPEDLEPEAPLIFFLHGYQGKASDYQQWLGLDLFADKYRFAVCYPQGSEDFSGTPHWNADLRISNVDDVGYLVKLAERLVDDNGFLPDQVFTSGLSNGGFMSYTLICKASETFHAMASIIGTMSGETWLNCDSEIPRPILQLSGVADDVVPIDGSMTTSGGWGGAPHMDVIMQYWFEELNCKQTDTSYIGPNTQVLKSTNGKGLDLWYYKIEGMGHNYPVEENEAGFNGGELLSEFFAQY